MNSTTPLKPRPAPGQQGSTPFRSSSANRFRSSLVPMNRPSPAHPSQLKGKLATAPSYGRDLFRTSTPQTTRTAKFAPSLPADATRTTPSARKFAQKTTQGGMSSIASTEPFKMRIPSPDPELSGEALSKEVPDDPTRTGTIYADQFLAHKCPPNFDDLQRRQFFCILDLRRLKYAADEIFAKKDWKLNIMNFAKEYEKSRGLIMLRYGLYEFKNVKPSEEVLKRWRATHNLPDSKPEAENMALGTPTQANRRPGVATVASMKRKAEEDLAPKDNTLMASTANQNKRRNVAQEPPDASLTGPAPFKKSKRKVDEANEPDENQPNKLHKPAPSAAKSKFESIINKTQSGSPSPLKRPPLASFGAQRESQNPNLNKSNPFATASNGYKSPMVETVEESNSTGSVLSGHKIGSAPATNTGNIFSYLSESSANSSGNENGNADDGADDDDGETESESEEEVAAGGEEAGPSDQPSATSSAGTNTPSTQSGSVSFSTDKPSTASNIFGGMTKPNDLTAKGGLFGRVQMGSDGQPLRATTDVEEQGVLAPVKQPVVEKEQSRTPAKQPGDYTFNPATTPISFGAPASNVAKTPATISKAESSKPNDASTTKTPASLFGAGAPATPAFQPTAASLFGAPNKTSDPSQAKSNGDTSSIFSGQTFGTFGRGPTTPLFGAATPGETDSSTIKDQQKGASDATPTPQVGARKTPSIPEEPISIFGASATNAASAPQPKSVFGSNLKSTESLENRSDSGQSMFGSVGKPAASSFGAPSKTVSFGGDGARVNGSSTAKSVFDTSSKQSSTGFTFGNSKPEITNEANTAAKPVFGSEGLKPTTTTGSPVFGGNSTASPSLFNAKMGQATGGKESNSPATASLFGNNSTTSASMFNSNKASDATPAEKKDDPMGMKSSIFNQTPSSTEPTFAFGASSPAPATNDTKPSSTPSMIFGAGANVPQSNGSESKMTDFQFGNPAPSANTSFSFGQGSPASGFTFTAGSNGQSFNNPFASTTAQPSAPMFGGKPTTPAPSSSFNFGFSQQAPSTPNPAPATPGKSIFGASPNVENGAPSFSFTQATPAQGTPSLFAAKPTPTTAGGTSSLFPTGGDASTGANSPFPAPSSIGTTPVNGTPEPQTQNEDGEEVTQGQLSLTEGGPGEEDETILHEVRAKAIKYVPVVKGNNEEEEKKSPWSTQGVGPLRVLKNKTTGTVRVLLRAEPRGHIAMNKALLSDIEYKAKDKTVNFVAASDNGSGLETWVLQVKKSDFAQQLAGVLEAHKTANKK